MRLAALIAKLMVAIARGFRLSRCIQVLLLLILLSADLDDLGNLILIRSLCDSLQVQGLQKKGPPFGVEQHPCAPGLVDRLNHAVQRLLAHRRELDGHIGCTQQAQDPVQRIAHQVLPRLHGQLCGAVQGLGRGPVARTGVRGQHRQGNLQPCRHHRGQRCARVEVDRTNGLERLHVLVGPKGDSGADVALLPGHRAGGSAIREAPRGWPFLAGLVIFQATREYAFCNVAQFSRNSLYALDQNTTAKTSGTPQVQPTCLLNATCTMRLRRSTGWPPMRAAGIPSSWSDGYQTVTCSCTGAEVSATSSLVVTLL